jgi:hypothetical protein
LGKNSPTNVAIVAEIMAKVTDICLNSDVVVVDVTANNLLINLFTFAVVVDVTNSILPNINLRANVAVLVDT